MVPESALRAEGGDAELADLGRQGPNDFFNGLLAPAAGKFDSASAADPTALAGSGSARGEAVHRGFGAVVNLE